MHAHTHTHTHIQTQAPPSPPQIVWSWEDHIQLFMKQAAKPMGSRHQEGIGWEKNHNITKDVPSLLVGATRTFLACVSSHSVQACATCSNRRHCSNSSNTVDEDIPDTAPCLQQHDASLHARLWGVWSAVFPPLFGGPSVSRSEFEILGGAIWKFHCN